MFTIPDELKLFNQFVLWKLVQTSTRLAKLPYQVTGHVARINDPSTWSSYHDCVATFVKQKYDGIGFVLTQHDPFTAIDFDHVIDAGNKINQWVKGIIQNLQSYTEVSQSGKGLHTFIRTTKTKINRRIQLSTDQSIEVYNTSRFIALTGRFLHQYPLMIQDCEEQLHDIISNQPALPVVQSWTNDRECPVCCEDRVVIEAVLYRFGERFSKLLNGDCSDYDNDHSRCDLAFVSMVARHCLDKHQVERIWLQQSLLGRREKVVRRLDYRQRTIDKAFSSIKFVYAPHDATHQ